MQAEICAAEAFARSRGAGAKVNGGMKGNR